MKSPLLSFSKDLGLPVESFEIEVESLLWKLENPERVVEWWAWVSRGGLPLLLTLKGNFGSWHAPSTTVFLAKKGEGAVSVDGIWFLSVQASVKVWGRELERKRLCKDFTVVGLLVFFEALWVSEPGSGLGCAIWWRRLLLIFLVCLLVLR